MSQLQSNEQYLLYAQNLWQKGHRTDYIEKELMQTGLQEELVQEAINHLKKLGYAKRRARGMKLLMIGFILLLAGFFCTLFISSYSENSFQYSLYGLTLVGISLVLAGMIDIMG